jgi:hypothetical protein
MPYQGFILFGRMYPVCSFAECTSSGVLDWLRTDLVGHLRLCGCRFSRTLGSCWGLTIRRTGQTRRLKCFLPTPSGMIRCLNVSDKHQMLFDAKLKAAENVLLFDFGGKSLLFCRT